MFLHGKIKAFTMAEAILTMVILGVIASIMIANLKPVQYRNQGFTVITKKIYSELDEVLNTIQVTCASGMSLDAVYDSCEAKDGTATHVFGANTSDADLLKSYIRDIGDCDTAMPDGYVTKFKLKNGACIALKSATIWIDVNDKEGPNSDDVKLDRYVLSVGADGITTKPADISR